MTTYLRRPVLIWGLVVNLGGCMPAGRPALSSLRVRPQSVSVQPGKANRQSSMVLALGIIILAVGVFLLIPVVTDKS